MNAVLFKLDDVEFSKDDATTFGKYKRVAAIDRGICDNCNKPVMAKVGEGEKGLACLLYTSPSPRDRTRSRMPSSA